MDQAWHEVMWKNIMERVHEGLEYKDFTMPSTVEQKTICTQTGLLATATCPPLTEYFAKGTAPSQSCSGHYVPKEEKEDDEKDKDKDKDNDKKEENPENPDENGGSVTPPEGGGNEGGGNEGGFRIDPDAEKRFRRGGASGRPADGGRENRPVPFCLRAFGAGVFLRSVARTFAPPDRGYGNR